MKKVIALLAAAGWLFTACTRLEIEEPGLVCSDDYAGHPKHELYQEMLENYRESSGAPGAVMLVSRPGEDLWIGASGYSNLEYQTPFCTQTPFRTGSITKTFVATAVLQLAEEEKLDLDSSLSAYLPEIAAEIPGAEKITIRQLLAHTSGLIDPPNQSLLYQTTLTNDPEDFEEMAEYDRLERYVFGKKLLFDPGQGYSYSNANYWILGLLLEEIEGKSAQAVLEERIFVPLNLNGTYLEKRDDPEVARGYANTTGDRLQDVTLWDLAEGAGKADGGLVSTAADLNTFLQALFNGQLIPEASLEDMKKIQWSGCDNIFCEYGLGLELWKFENAVGYGHNGGLVGIEANALYFPEKETTVVIFKNNGNGSDKTFLEEILR